MSCPDSKTVRAKKREISIRYTWSARQRAGQISHSRMMTLRRLRELERLYAARQCLVDDDAGRAYLEIAAHHIAHLRGEIEEHIVQWCACWTPWLPAADAAEMAKRIAAAPRKWRADSLAFELNLTAAERSALDIRTIGAVDLTKDQRATENQKRRKARARARRKRNAAKAGRILRARPGRPRKIGTPQWETLGMSRSTWYRGGKPDGTNIRAPQGRLNAGHEYPCQALKAEPRMASGIEGLAPATPTAPSPSRTPARCNYLDAGEDDGFVTFAEVVRSLQRAAGGARFANDQETTQKEAA